jgi:shikimate dehydrogenase
MTIKAFVIGHPISHSRSPLIHNSWIAQYRLDGDYRAIDVAPEHLPDHFNRVRNGEFAGGNVTLPHKEAVFTLCDSVDALAQKIGAVNTVVARNGLIHGTNTDYLGFLGNLDQKAPGWDQVLETAIVLGAGGAARAVVAALASRGVKAIWVLNRTQSTAQTLADAFDVQASGLEHFADLAPRAGLVVNTTTLGMGGTRFPDLPLGRLPQGALVTDIVYTPLQTPLLLDAQALGLRTVDGLGMLLHQAVPGFEAWFGVRPTVSEALRETIVRTLEPHP